MAKPVVLPPEIIQAIEMLRSTPVDPSDFSNAVQECYNRGFGKMGKWIAEHKDLYLQALQDGYVSDLVVPNSEKDSVTLVTEIPVTTPEQPVEVDLESNPDTESSTEPTPPVAFPGDLEEAEEPFGKRHKRQ